MVTVVVRWLSLGKSSWDVDTELRTLFSHHLPMLEAYHIENSLHCPSVSLLKTLALGKGKKHMCFEENQILKKNGGYQDLEK